MNEYYFTTGFPKAEIKSIPINQDRVEIIKKILEQNQMILDFILESDFKRDVNFELNNFNVSSENKSDLAQSVKDTFGKLYQDG